MQRFRLASCFELKNHRNILIKGDSVGNIGHFAEETTFGTGFGYILNVPQLQEMEYVSNYVDVQVNEQHYRTRQECNESH